MSSGVGYGDAIVGGVPNVRTEPSWSEDSIAGTMPASPSSIESSSNILADPTAGPQVDVNKNSSSSGRSAPYITTTSQQANAAQQLRTPVATQQRLAAKAPIRHRDIAPAGGVAIRPAPSTSTAAPGSSAGGGGGVGGDKKILASGKRADQNRKAQRAFRQRKDKYIKDLELRSQELDVANSLIIQLKEENDRLNEIAKSFHSRIGQLEDELEEIYRSGNMSVSSSAAAIGSPQQQIRPQDGGDVGSGGSPVNTRYPSIGRRQSSELSPYGLDSAAQQYVRQRELSNAAAAAATRERSY